MKSLAEDMQKDAAEETEKVETKIALAVPAPAAPAKKAAAAPAKTDKKDVKAAPAPATKAAKPVAKPASKEVKKEEEEIPMDQAAIKAYSSVIADAAEDSEP